MTDKPTMTPETFKAWRKRMGWTQKEAAWQLGLSRGHVVCIEKGVGSRGQPVSPTHLHNLATKALEKLPETHR